MKQCLPRGKPPGEHSWVRLSKKEEKAIKKLQAELSEEKRAEKERSVAARTTA